LINIRIFQFVKWFPTVLIESTFLEKQFSKISP
jgi:hypothetical protein